MLQKTAYFKPFSAIIWSILSAILDFRVLEMSYDQINVRNGFLMFKLVENEFLITLIAQKLRILKMPDFLTAAILDCLLPPYAPNPRCLSVSNGLFRVSTVGKCNQNLWTSMLHTPKDSLLQAISSYYLVECVRHLGFRSIGDEL